MNRRDFFKRAAIVAAGAAAASLAGKAPEADAFGGTPDTGVVMDGGGAKFIVDGKQFVYGEQPQPAYTFAASTDTGYYRIDSKEYEWYDGGNPWKELADHVHSNPEA